MTSALHHSFALEVMSLTYGHDRTGTTSWDAAPHLVGCAGRSHFALHSYAFMKYIIEVVYPWHGGASAVLGHDVLSEARYELQACARNTGRRGGG
jgi:hypothetical protein